MTGASFEIDEQREAEGALALRFTPAEWRRLLADPEFLDEADNGYLPRRLMGLPVRIVPDHRFG